TMLINDIDYTLELENVGEYLKSLRKLDKVYISIPTRPPAEKWVKPANEKTINLAFQIFSKKVGAGKVELLLGYEGNSFTSIDNIESDLLSIIAVHPMRKDAVENLLKKAGCDWNIIERLLKENKVIKIDYEGKEYFLINFRTYLSA
ncbi:MAG: radical SAM protein, partial [Nitrososphaeria archaeon]